MLKQVNPMVIGGLIGLLYMVLNDLGIDLAPEKVDAYVGILSVILMGLGIISEPIKRQK